MQALTEHENQEPTEKSHPDASEGCQYDGHSEECSSDTGTETKTDSIMHHMFYQKKLYGIHQSDEIVFIRIPI